MAGVMDDSTLPMCSQSQCSEKGTGRMVTGFTLEKVVVTIDGLKARIEVLETEISQLRSIISDSIPSYSVAKDAVKVSKQVVLDTAEKLSEAELCSKRVIIWGHFPKKVTPMQQAQSLLNQTKPPIQKPARASWLVSKTSKKTIGLIVEFASDVQVAETLTQAGSIKRGSNYVRGVSKDKPLYLRMKKPSGLESRNLQKDPKLMRSPKVILTRVEIPGGPAKIALPPSNPPMTQLTGPLARSSPNVSLNESDSQEEVTMINLKPATKTPNKKRAKPQKKAADKKKPLHFKQVKTGILGDPPSSNLKQAPPLADTKTVSGVQVNPPVTSSPKKGDQGRNRNIDIKNQRGGPHFRKGLVKSRPPDRSPPCHQFSPQMEHTPNAAPLLNLLLMFPLLKFLLNGH